MEDIRAAVAACGEAHLQLANKYDAKKDTPRSMVLRYVGNLLYALAQGREAGTIFPEPAPDHQPENREYPPPATQRGMAEAICLHLDCEYEMEDHSLKNSAGVSKLEVSFKNGDEFIITVVKKGED